RPVRGPVVDGPAGRVRRRAGSSGHDVPAGGGGAGAAAAAAGAVRVAPGDPGAAGVLPADADDDPVAVVVAGGAGGDAVPGGAADGAGLARPLHPHAAVAARDGGGGLDGVRDGVLREVAVHPGAGFRADPGLAGAGPDGARVAAVRRRARGVLGGLLPPAVHVGAAHERHGAARPAGRRAGGGGHVADVLGLAGAHVAGRPVAVAA